MAKKQRSKQVRITMNKRVTAAPIHMAAMTAGERGEEEGEGVVAESGGSVVAVQLSEESVNEK